MDKTPNDDEEEIEMEVLLEDEKTYDVTRKKINHVSESVSTHQPSVEEGKIID